VWPLILLGCAPKETADAEVADSALDSALDTRTGEPPLESASTETEDDTASALSCPKAIDGCEEAVPCVGDWDGEDASSCCIIVGDLDVEGHRLIENRFAAMRCLQEVTGTIDIQFVAIHTLSLENLMVVGDDLKVTNSEVDHLAFPRLERVDYLGIRNDSLLDLSGFPSLTSLNAVMVGGESLQSLDGMEQAFSLINGNFLIADGFGLTDLDAMLHLPASIANFGLSGLGSVAPPLLPLQNVAGVDIIETSLTNVDFLTNVRTIDGEGVRVWENPVLTSLSGLSAATGTLRTILILDNDALTSLDGLQGVTTVAENIDIRGNPRLASVRLDGLNHVGGRIWISEVYNATQVAMPALEEVEADFYWHGPDHLDDMTGLDALRSIGGTFWLATDAHSLVGLGSLEYMSHFLLEYSRNLPDLTGLDSLHTVDGLLLFLNPGLESTRGADALERVRRIIIIGNPHLAELSFPSLTDVAYVHIEDNRSLPTCQIDRLQEQLAAYGSFPDFDVANNGTDDPTACD
jgi:hypothetical protein